MGWINDFLLRLGINFCPMTERYFKACTMSGKYVVATVWAFNCLSQCSDPLASFTRITSTFVDYCKFLLCTYMAHIAS